MKQALSNASMLEVSKQRRKSTHATKRSTVLKNQHVLILNILPYKKNVNIKGTITIEELHIA
jgi:hypothetical protein